MSFQVILIIHIFLALALVALILVQHGKGADAGAAFGSGAAGSVFGARGANSFLYKLTASIAIGFFLTSLTLAYLASDSGDSTDSQSIMQPSSQIAPPANADVPIINPDELPPNPKILGDIPTQ